MIPKKVLIGARKLLAEKGWCQGAYARDLKGQPVWEFVGSKAPVAYCALGAIIESAGGAGEEARNVFSSVIDNNGLPAWNDHPSRTKEEVLTAFDQAIKLASEKE